jgi:hypothetical protein
LVDELLDFLCYEILVFIQIVEVMTLTYRRKMEALTRHQSTNSGHKTGSRCLLTYEMNGEVDLEIDVLIVNPKVMPLVQVCLSLTCFWFLACVFGICTYWSPFPFGLVVPR